MSEELNNQEEFSVETAVGKFKARGSDILTTITLVMVCIIAYGGWKPIPVALDWSKLDVAQKHIRNGELFVQLSMRGGIGKIS